jgi:acetyltransferase
MEGADSEAEFAIVIDDDWQGKGLGAHLLSDLIDLARQSGIRRMFWSTLSKNRGILELVCRFGLWRSRESREPGAAIITMPSLTLRPGA